MAGPDDRIPNGEVLKYVGSRSLMYVGIHPKNYTSIDPKQLQNDSFRPILVKHRFLGTPYLHPKSKLLHQ